MRPSASLRLLYLLRYYPTLTETFVYREIDGLMARGHRVTVGSFGARADGALQDELPAAPLLRPPTAPAYLPLLAELAPVLGRASGRRQLAWLQARMRPKDALKALWLAHRARRFDRVHVHFAGEAALWALAAWRLHAVPYSVTVHAVDLFKPRPELGELLAEASAVFSISSYNQRLLEERYGVSARLLRCGVPPWPGPAPDPARQPLVVVAVGRWVPKKGLDLLVRAVERLEQPVQLLLVSDAPSTLASERVRCLGLLPPARLREVVARAGLLALPCRRAEDGDMDGIPVALMEALSAGLPVLSTPVSGIPELVDEEVGWLVPPDDLDALAGCLSEIASRPGLRARRGAAGPGRLEARGFSLDSQVEGLLRAWNAGTAPA
jgi:colanic acid/amylovoran biosynthesis glycosyltransferase